jgi:hypothetical protein
MALAGAAVTIIAVLLYFALFWNRFVGLRSGTGDYNGGTALLAGIAPYRDYFFASTPLDVLKSALELKLFGNALVVTRACGVGERLLLSLIVFCWLKRMFRASDAALAAIVTMIASTGDDSDPIGSYNHTAILLSTASGFVASHIFGAIRTQKQFAMFAVAAGLLAGLSFATKQTIGLASTVALPIICAAVLSRTESARQAITFLVWFATGWACAAGALLLWLAHLGVLSNFLTDVFIAGPKAKGASHPSDFLLRAWIIVRPKALAVVAAAAALAVSARSVRRSGQGSGSRKDRIGHMTTVLILAAAAIAAGYSVCRWNLSSGVTLEHQPLLTWCHAALRTAIFYTVFASLAIGVFFGAKAAHRSLEPREAQFCLFAGVSLACALMISLSFPVFEAMIVPGMALPVAAILDKASGWKRAASFGLCGLLIALETYAKLVVPFAFAGFAEPSVVFANRTFTTGPLRGLVLPQSTARFAEGTLSIIGANARPGEPIFTYPEMGFFYAASGHSCPTVTCSHNIDVVNDELARTEAKRLSLNKPAVLVYWPQSEYEIEMDEKLWRHGNRSGNREIVNAVERLAAEDRLVSTYVVPPDAKKVLVLAREPND